MLRKATVTELLPEGRAELVVRRESACSGDCHKCAGCGAVEQILRLSADNPLGAQKGDIVWLESESAPVLRAAAAVYLLPLALFLAGYLLAQELGAWAALVGVGGFLLGLLPAFAYDRHLKKHPPKYTVVGWVE